MTSKQSRYRHLHENRSGRQACAVMTGAEEKHRGDRCEIASRIQHTALDHTVGRDYGAGSIILP